MAESDSLKRFQIGFAMCVLLLMIMSTTLTHISYAKLENYGISQLSPTGGNFWNPDEQPWGQFAKNPSRNSSTPAHGVNSAGSLATIDDPVVNWVALEGTDGSSLYGSIIGNFSTSITVEGNAIERCGQGDLFPVIVWSDADSSTSKLSIISGDDADVAWEVDLGSTRDIRSTPAILDANNDGAMEIVIAYETTTQVIVDLWSPELRCSESGWQVSGHSNEKIWSWTSSDYSLSTPSPHLFSSQSGHRAVTQPLVADLSFDGIPEIVLALVDENTEEPTVISLPLDTSSAPEPDFEVSLDRGTNPSDPAWAALDSSTSAIVLTTIDSNSGSMWVWRIDGTSGSLDWERVALSGTDQDQDSPRLRLPGPVITQLDGDSAPEMILTIPTDANGGSSGQGARYIGMELTSTTQIFEFRATNGYADVQPLMLDTDDDGIDDRLCWTTWYASSWTDREGMIGCHDVSQSPPSKDWSRIMNRGSGNDNDEIAVSSPIALDVNGDAVDEIIVPFGRRLFAFDGETGAQTDVSTNWESALSLPHRTWASPAVSDVDGDGFIDILIGDVLVSQRLPDFAPLQDNRGLTFNPVDPDPGDLVTVTGQLANFGVTDGDAPLDISITLNNVEILRERIENTEPISPSGEGGPITVSTTFTAELGLHELVMTIDVNGNITESQEDNNQFRTEIAILAPYVARIDIPSETTRIIPGNTSEVDIVLTGTGSRESDWSLSWTEYLNQGWSFSIDQQQSTTFTLQPNLPQIVSFSAFVPETALGDESGYVNLTLTNLENTSITSQATIPIEVLRTRGISIEGPEGLSESTAYGRQGSAALGWLRIKNLGNAQESTTSLDWTNPSWPGTPSLVDSMGTELFSVDLSPGQEIEIFAKLDVPQNAPIESSSNSTLTLCIGQGDQEICESIDVMFISSNIEINPVHIRTLPDNNISRMVKLEIPNTGQLRWNFASSGLFSPEYTWSVQTSNSLATVGFNASWLEVSGPNGMVFELELTMHIDEDAVPARLSFNAEEENLQNHNLRFSTHILQVYRAQSEIVSPIPDIGETAVSLNVSEEHRVLLRLSNPGNGEDSYTLSGSVVEESASNFTPQVEFIYFTPTKTLGAKANTISTVDIILSSETPAQSEFDIEFSWQSLSDPDVVSKSIIRVMAEPDNRWDWNTYSSSNQTINPGEEVTLSFNITNTGNTVNSAGLDSSINYNFAGSDIFYWGINSSTSENLEINDYTNISIGIIANQSSWAGTTAAVDVILTSGGYEILTMRFNFTVNRVSGWSFNLSSSDLVVHPDGGNVTLELNQMGNTPTVPYYAKASQGWPVEMPDFGGTVNPSESTNLTIQVNPPKGLLAGTVGVVRILVTDADGLGQTFQEVPLRIGSAPSIQLENKGTWKVNSDIGYPTAWINNSGNDLSPIELEVLNLPLGWQITGNSRIVIPSGQTIGVPLGLVPPADWDKSSILLGLRVNHPDLDPIETAITVEYSKHSFASSPVGFGIEDRTWIVDISDESSEYLSEVNSFTSDYQEIEIEQESDILMVHLFGIPLTTAEIDCDFNSIFFQELGLSSKSGQIAECDITTSEDEKFNGRVVMITSTSEILELNNDDIFVQNNTTSQISINVTNWLPEVGEHELFLYVLDEYGNTLASENTFYTAYQSGWNLGIFSITTDKEIRVGIQREGWELLGDTVCVLDIVASDGWSTQVRVDVTGNYAPTVVIEAPADMETDTKINATIGCSSPFNLESDMSDNSKEGWYIAPGAVQISSSDLFWTIGITIVIISLLAALGLLKSPNQNQLTTSKEKNNVNQSGVETKAKKESEPDIKSMSASDKEIARERMSKMMSDVDLSTELDELDEIQQDEQELILEEPVIELEEDDSVQSRFAALREELSDAEGEDRGSVEDRMKKFFGE